MLLEQHDAGTQALDELEPVMDAVGGADGDETGLGTEEHRQPGADGRLGVHDGDPGHGGNPSSRA